MSTPKFTSQEDASISGIAPVAAGVATPTKVLEPSFPTTAFGETDKKGKSVKRVQTLLDLKLLLDL